MFTIILLVWVLISIFLINLLGIEREENKNKFINGIVGVFFTIAIPLILLSKAVYGVVYLLSLFYKNNSLRYFKKEFLRQSLNKKIHIYEKVYRLLLANYREKVLKYMDKYFTENNVEIPKCSVDSSYVQYNLEKCKSKKRKKFIQENIANGNIKVNDTIVGI